MLGCVMFNKFPLIMTFLLDSHLCVILQHQHLRQGYAFKYAVENQISNGKYVLKLIKRRSKVHQRNISQKRGLNFDR